MKKQKNKMVHVTLDEARKMKSHSNPAQIIAQQVKDEVDKEEKDKD